MIFTKCACAVFLAPLSAVMKSLAPSFFISSTAQNIESAAHSVRYSLSEAACGTEEATCSKLIGMPQSDIRVFTTYYLVGMLLLALHPYNIDLANQSVQHLFYVL
mmetsp:Transcript_30508/g.29406  ORF Transcript_30508/g.29406 Transcript_30508/m.29406 type:complete len:105 (+) Transcript_30508:179-493(+)